MEIAVVVFAFLINYVDERRDEFEKQKLVDSTRKETAIESIAFSVEENAVLFYLGLTALGVLSVVLYLNNERKSGWSLIKVLVDTLDTQVFKDRNNLNKTHHRVTLFKYKPQSWLRCRRNSWLVPIVRSGHLAQATKTKFTVSQDPDKCHGVVGLAWKEDRAIPIFDLPDIATSNSVDEKITVYCSQTNTPTDWVYKRRATLARSFFALRIDIDKKPWGVLIFDSRIPNKILIEDFYAEFPTFREMLLKILNDYDL